MSQSPAVMRSASTVDRLRGVLAQARFNRQEIAGSLGDLGTFLPLLVGMTVQNGLNFATALFFAGLFNIVTGLLFTVPMAVQPMKAIAAIAITQGMTVPQIVAAGAMVSLLVFLLGVTGLIGWLNRAIPPATIRGLQLAVGLSLTIKGMQMVVHTGHWLTTDGFAVGIGAAVVSLLLAESKRVPAALVLFAAGLGLAIWQQPAVVHTLGIRITWPQLAVPSWHDFAAAGTKAALPQLPLTTLNSVVAVCALATSLFPDRDVAPRRVAVSVGMMNLVGMWFGAMPMCHGAGGLAGQYRFGARTNGAILVLGGAKVLLAVLFGASLLALAMAFPASILGVMLAASGVELAMSIRGQAQHGRDAWLIVLVTAGACLGLDSIALGLVVGIVCYWLLWLAAKEEA